MNSHPEVPATVIQNPDLANVMGYAEYPYIEVARVAEQNGMPDLASHQRGRAELAAAIAGKEWIELLGQQFTSVTGEPIIAGIPEETLDIIRYSDNVEPELQQSTPEIPLVDPGVVARVVATVLSHKGEKSITVKDVAKQADTSTSTARRAIYGLGDLDLIQRGEAKGKVGRPEVTAQPNESLHVLAEKTPTW